MNKVRHLIGNKEKALLHVARAQLGLDEETYRAVLASEGVQSSRELDRAQFDRIMHRLEACGFTGAARRRHTVQSPQPAHAVPDAKRPLVSKIGALLGEMNLPWNYVDGIARRMFGLERAAWCDPAQLKAVVAALVVHKKRKGKAND